MATTLGDHGPTLGDWGLLLGSEPAPPVDVGELCWSGLLVAHWSAENGQRWWASCGGRWRAMMGECLVTR